MNTRPVVLAASIAALLAAAPPRAKAAAYTWNVDLPAATWGSAANWNPNSAFPNVAGDVANLTNNITQNNAITLDAAITVGILNLGDPDGSNSFSISGGVGGSLIFDNSGLAAQINQGVNSLGDTIAATMVSTAGALNVTNDASFGLLTLSGSLNMGANSVTFGGSGATTLSGALTGTAALVKNGAGRLVLSGANTTTFFGGVTINGGAVSINNAGNLGDVSGALALNGGTLETTATTTTGRVVTLANAAGNAFDTATGNFTISGVVSGAGAFTKLGTGVLALTNAGNTFGGVGAVITINGGAVSAAADAALGNVNNALVIDGGALQASGTFTLAATRSVTLSGFGGGIDVTTGNVLTVNHAITGAGSFAKSGAGTLQLSAAQGYLGDTNVLGGTLAITAVNVLPNTNLVLSGGTLDIGANNQTVSSVTMFGGGIAGTTGVLTSPGYDVQAGTASAILAGGPLVKNGGGTAVLSGVNTFTGTVDINGGVLSVNANGALGNAANAVVLNGGALNATATFTPARNITLNSTFGNGLGADAGQTLTVGNNLLGTGGFTKIGAGTVELAGTNPYTFTDPLGVNLGVLLLNKPVGVDAIPNVPVAITSSAAGQAIIRLAASEQINNAAPLSWNINGGQSGTLDLNGFIETVGDLVISTTSTGTTTGANGVRTGAGGTLILNGNVTFNNNRNATGNTGRELLLTATGTYGTTVSGGGTLDLGGTNRTFTTNTNNAQAATNAMIDLDIVNGGIIKEGPRVLVLNGAASTFAGGVTINGGAVALTNSSATNTFSGGFLLNTGGTLQANNTAANPTFDQQFGAVGNSFTFDGGAFQANYGVNDRTMTNRTFTVNAGGGTFNINGTYSAAFVETNVTQLRVTTATSTLIGSGQLTKTGGGRLTLNSNSPSFSGPWVVNNGTLEASGGTARLGDGSTTNTLALNGGNVAMGLAAYAQNVTLNGGAISSISNTTVGTTTLVGTVNVAAASHFFLNDFYQDLGIAKTIAVNGALSGSAALNVEVNRAGTDANSGTLILQNAGNSYSGTISVGKNLRLQSNVTGGVGSGLSGAAVTLASGHLQLRDNGAGSNGALAYGNNVTLAVPAGLLANGDLAGTNTINVDRSSGANTGNTFQLGTLTFGAGVTALDVTGANRYVAEFLGATTLTGSTTFNPTTADLKLTGGISGGTDLIKTGAANLYIGNPAGPTYTGVTTISVGGVVFGTAAAIGGTGASITVATGGTVAAGYAIDQAFVNRVGNSSTGVIAAAANSANAVNLTGYGFVRFGAIGTASYTGVLTPAAAGVYALGGGGGTLVFPTTNYFTGAVSLNLGVNGTTPGVVALTAANDFTGSITLTGGQLLRPQTNASLGNAANVITGDGGGVQFASGAPFDLFAARTITFSAGGFILDTNGNDFTPSAGITGNAGSGAFTKAGAGVLTFSAINTYTGATNVNGGVIAFANPSVLAVSSGLGANGGTFRYTGATAATLGKTIAVGTTPGALTIDVSNAAGDLTADQIISGGPAAGSVGLTKTGPGTLTLTNTGNTFTGNILVNGGTFVYAGQAGAAASVLGAAGAKSITVDNGATLRATSASNLTSVTSVIVGPGGAIFDTPVTAGVNLQMDDIGQFSGTGNLTKTGAGTLQLGGVTGMNFSSYTGQIFVNAGTLLAANADGTTNRFVLGADTVATTIANSAAVDVRGLSTEPFILQTGSQLLNGGGVAGIVNGTLTPTGNFTIGGAGTLTINSNIGTGFSVTKSLAGTTTLTAANTNSGAARITNGVLALGGASGALPSAASVTIDSTAGGTLQFNNEAAADVFTSNNGDRLPNATPIALNVSSTIWVRGVNSTTPGPTSAEVVGPVTLTNAQGTLRADSATPANTTTILTVSSLNRVGATVAFLQHSSAGTLGVGDRIVITSGAPTPVNGMVSPRFLNNTEQTFVTYGGSGFANAAFNSTDLNTAAATSIVDQGATAVALASNKTAYAVKLGTGAVTTNVLTIGSGGLILAGAATHSSGFTFNNGAQNIEGIVFAPTGVTAVHTGQVVASALTKVGGGELNLNPSASAVTAGGLNNATISVLGGTLRIASNTATNNNAVLPSSVKIYSAAGSTTIFQANSTISSLTGTGTVQVGTDVGGATALTLTLNNNVDEVFNGTLQSDEANQDDISLTKGGSGTFTLNNIYQSGRSTQVNFGELIITGTANPSASTGAEATIGAGRQRIVALQGGTLTIDNTVTNSADRFRLNSGTTGSIIQLTGGTLNYYGNATAPSTETLGVTTAGVSVPNFGAGMDTINLTAGSGQSSIVTVALPFTRSAGASALIRGTGLGGTRGGANTTTLAYSSAPTLVGGAGALGTTTASIFNGVFADSVIGGVDTFGLATYDTGTTGAYDADDIGIRRLSASELAANITDGSAVLDNVRLTGASNAITAATTINSLHLDAGGSINGAGTLTINSATILGTGANGGIGTTTPGTLAFGASEANVFSATALTVGSVITGTNGLTKAGNGTLTLTNAANSFSGGQGVTINGGLLRVSADAALGAGANTVRLNNGGGLQAGATFSSARAVALGNAGGVISVANLADTLTLTGILSGNLGAVTAGIAANTGTVAQTTTVLTKTGPGKLVLNGVNTYTGRTSIEGGTLAINADAALGNTAGGVAVSNDAILQAIGAITSSRAFVLGAGGGGQIDTNGNAVTLGAASSISGTELSKLGAGTLTIAGTQTYATLTTEAGTVTLDSALGTGASTVNANGGTTNFNVSQTLAALNIGNDATVILVEDLSPAPPFPAGSETLAAADGLGESSGIDGIGAALSFGDTAQVAAVPEPGTFGLLALGALGMLVRRRRHS